MDSFVQVISAPASFAMRSAWLLTETGSATEACSRVEVTSVRSAINASSLVSTWPSSSMSVMCSPSGSITAPRWAFDVRTSSATYRACTSTSKAAAPAVDA